MVVRTVVTGVAAEAGVVAVVVIVPRKSVARVRAPTTSLRIARLDFAKRVGAGDTINTIRHAQIIRPDYMDQKITPRHKLSRVVPRRETCQEVISRHKKSQNFISQKFISRLKRSQKVSRH